MHRHGTLTISSIILIMVFISVTINLNCSCKSVTAQTFPTTPHPSFLIYENSSLGLQIQYPSNWTKVENTGNVTFYSILPNSSKTSIVHPQLHILAKPFHNETLIQSSNEVVNNYTKSKSAFKLLKTTPVDTNGLLADMILYNYKAPKLGVVNGVDFILTNNESNYYISYKASPAFSKYLSTMVEMINTIKLLAPGDLGVYLQPYVSIQGPSSRLSVGILAPDILAQLLLSFSKETIQQYNFNDMTTDQLVNLFSSLSSPDLIKLFDELPHNEVTNLLNRIPVDERSSILNKLPLDKHEQYLR